MQVNSLSSHYRLNPFSFVSETPASIIINTTPIIQATFSKSHRAIVDLLIRGDRIPTDELLKRIAPERLRELVSKRILLAGEAPPLEGRYSRQLGFFSLTTADFNETQEKLNGSHVLVLGAGALGSHVLWNLAAIGVGKITVVDFDLVEETNLNRQLTYTPEDVGQHKVDILSAKISQFNPKIEITPIGQRITSADDIAALLPGKSLVVKAIDTPEDSTIWLNHACVESQVPFINGGFLDYTGVVGPTYIPNKSLCISCFAPTGKITRLAGTGPTFAPLTTIVSSQVSMLAYKILVGDADPIVNKLYSFDTVRMSWQETILRSEKRCDVCARAPDPPVPKISDHRRLRGYRLSIAVVMVAAVILRVGFHQTQIGLLTLLMLILTVPFVRILHEGDLSLTRRELFVTSCIYIAISGAGLLVESFSRGTIIFPSSVSMVMDALRVFSVSVLQLSIGITVLFFILCVTLEFATRSQVFSPKSS